MREYVSPTAERIVFSNEKILAGSGTCRCYLDIGVKFDYNDFSSGCWSDSEDATAYDMHDVPIDD